MPVNANAIKRGSFQLFDVMLRKIYSISRAPVLSFSRNRLDTGLVVDTSGFDCCLIRRTWQTHRTILAICWILLIEISQENLSEQLGSAVATKPRDNGHLQQQHPSSLVDTKYWLQDTEFVKQANWLDRKKPCTLLERVEVIEEAVVSLGDSLGAIDGRLRSVDIRELTLPMNGVLLFEEDSNLNDPVDPNYISYLNESGECLDSGEQSDATNATVFRFSPGSDSMSWFNPENWASALYDEYIEHLMPDSHRVPCTEDIVVFGDRQFDLATLETNEQSKLMSFKVNFRSSSLVEENMTSTSDGSQIRIARLVIGELRYNQTEFEQLLEVYGDTLFEFHNNHSMLAYGPIQSQPVLIIDESSLQLSTDEDHTHGRCNDEAGCFCGNEVEDKMRALCSFNGPLSSEDQPCYDPIPSSGYCNNICATVLTLSIDPTKFSERFLTSIIDDKLMDVSTISQQHFSNSVFSVTRRVQDTRYEITFIHAPQNTEKYESSFGIEHEFAALITDSLNSGKYYINFIS